jgi:hypothetical protein
MSEAVATLVKGYRNLSDEEQEMFHEIIESEVLAKSISAEPGFQEFLAERLAEAEDPAKLGYIDDLYAEVLQSSKGLKR